MNQDKRPTIEPHEPFVPTITDSDIRIKSRDMNVHQHILEHGYKSIKHNPKHIHVIVEPRHHNLANDDIDILTHPSSHHSIGRKHPIKDNKLNIGLGFITVFTFMLLLYLLIIVF